MFRLAHVLLVVSIVAASVSGGAVTADTAEGPTAAESNAATLEVTHTVRTFRGSSYPDWAAPCANKDLRVVTITNRGETPIDRSQLTVAVNGNESVYGFSEAAFDCGDGSAKAFPAFLTTNEQSGELPPGESVEIVGYGTSYEQPPGEGRMDGMGWVLGNGGPGELMPGDTDVSERVTAIELGDTLTIRYGDSVVVDRELREALQLEQTSPGNIVPAGEDPVLDVETRFDRVRWAAYDFQGRQVDRGSTAAADGSARITVGAPAPGYYELVVHAGDRTMETSVGVLPAEPIETTDRFFGVSPGHSHRGREVVFPLYEAAGFQTNRGGHQWAEVEQRKGEYNFSEYDELHRLATSHGLEPFPIVAYGNPIYHDEADWYGSKTAPITDTQRRAYARYAGALASHFDDISAIEVWNEYDHSSFSQGPARHEPRYYVQLLEPTYEAVKRADPDVTVVGGAVASGAGGTRLNLPWWRGVFERGGGDHMDAMSIHPYRWPNPKKLEHDVERLRALTRNQTGETKPIWITELGSDTDQGSVTLENQAHYVPKAHARAKAAGVERFYWYNFVDQSVTAGRFGLVRNPKAPEGAYTPKPSYFAYATMTRHLTGASPISQSTEPVRDYAFETPGGETTHVLWTDEPTPVTVETDGPLTVTTIMGRSTRLSPSDGTVALPVSGEPLYVEGTIGAIGEGVPVSLSAPDRAVGESIPVTATLDNTDGTSERTTSVAIGGTTRTLSAPAGERDTATISIPAGSDPRDRTITATLRSDGDPVGLVRTETTVTPAVTATLAPTFEDGDARPDALELRVESLTRDRSHAITGFEWSIGDHSGSRSVERELAAGTTQPFSLEAPDLDAWNGHSASVSVSFADRPALHHDATVSYAPIAQRSITVDGELDGLADTSHISLPADGQSHLESSDGPEDLSGDVWLTYDDEHLYLSASVRDDNHSAGWPLWEHDSIQLGVAPGYPGQHRNFSEFQIALSPDGPRVFRGYQPTGPGASVLSSADVEVRHADGQTVYEAAIPWAALRTEPGSPTSLSLLINENDGDGRAGWIEWASGIGTNKDSSQFYHVQFVGADRPTATDSTGDGEPGGDPTADGAGDPTETSGPAPNLVVVLAAVVLGVIAGRRRRQH